MGNSKSIRVEIALASAVDCHLYVGFTACGAPGGRHRAATRCCPTKASSPSPVPSFVSLTLSTLLNIRLVCPGLSEAAPSRAVGALLLFSRSFVAGPVPVIYLRFYLVVRHEPCPARRGRHRACGNIHGDGISDPGSDQRVSPRLSTGRLEEQG